MKEEYENVKTLLDMIKYTRHNWELCGDFKMLAFLLGQQGGYTKYSCFLCLWNSRADEQHYSRKLWPLREELTPGAHNVIRQPRVQRERKDFVANTSHKAWSCKALHKSIEIRQ